MDSDCLPYLQQHHCTETNVQVPVYPYVLVLCKYLKFRIESNSYFSIRFDSKQVQLFEIFEYLPSPICIIQNDADFSA